MTRVVVPRSNAPQQQQQQQQTTRQGSTSTSASTTSPAPPDVSEQPTEATGAPVELELVENQIVSRLGSLRLEDPRSSDSEGTKEPVVIPQQQESESLVVQQAPMDTTSNALCPMGTSSSSARTGGSRRSSFTGPRPAAAAPANTPQRHRSSPTTSSHSTSPKAHAAAGEGDGYNSADESSASWSSSAAPPVFEEDEDKEGRFEVELRRVKGYEVRRMVPDGNCLFRAVADQVYGDPEMYAETRHMCIDYMERERDHFSQFVTESFTAYCKRKRKDKVYGNNLEIQAMAEMYNRPIHIYMYSTEPINSFHGQYETDLPPIRLSYHRRNHYNSLRDPTRPAIGAGLGFGSLRGTNVDGDQVKAAIRAQQDQQIENALVAEGRYYSDLELTEQEIERMVMEASRAEYLAHRAAHASSDETSSSAGGEPSSSGGASRGSGGSGSGATGIDTGVSRNNNNNNNNNNSENNSNVRLLLSMGFNYLRVMEACSIFGDDVNNILCYLLESDRMKGKAAEKS